MKLKVTWLQNFTEIQSLSMIGIPRLPAYFMIPN